MRCRLRGDFRGSNVSRARARTRIDILSVIDYIGIEIEFSLVSYMRYGKSHNEIDIYASLKNRYTGNIFARAGTKIGGAA